MFHNPSPVCSWGASRDRGLSQKPGDGQEIGAGVSRAQHPEAEYSHMWACALTERIKINLYLTQK